MFKRISRYWWCQILGWTAYSVVNLFFAYSFAGSFGSYFLVNLLVIMFFGMVATHLLRSIIKRLNWFQYSFESQMLLFFALTVSSGVIIYVGNTIAGNLYRYSWQQRALTDQTTLTFLLPIFLITSIWWLIYFVWHYIERSRNSQVDKLKLESTVKELELKTIKSQLNPHFIFNALNSIRALVDENPQRARTAITELSNILRSSMQVEKAETVNLENELDIVKDYLALENIRFEERLRVQYDIDPETLELPIPPMMLQTLVENAIKHGISRTVSGGTVIIGSHVRDTHHEITIENTGQIGGAATTGHGFGLQSTRQRLSLLYGNKASFNIYNKNEETVEAIVLMPLF
ncbi:sensor histidine kinase [Chitinophaga pinensis]|uniref:Signal transduction histidine kinase, LytS n=1 Tax=Chitinophaga pinensis (strain ATCC 43595 / DSM 2588 / LMG 13176 / NBRC 15968 / NCIMB 11800 / UQM 2034) TaxID=485918 RepID=A0A979GQ19_CHIPD|nr:histidine kinase [Chitinophaga pinensis]ACU57874.1 signal transduction histidine kinase, LytS [Chitinophaga pinensis DSM 2588]